MKELADVPFPRYIDKPRMVGILEMDEAFLAVGFIVASVIIGFLFRLDSTMMMMGGLFTGLLSAWLFHKFKIASPDGYTWHFVYRKGLYHPVIDNLARLKFRKDIKKHNLKIIPTGIVTVFIE
jgi:hypothetical protein